MDPINPIQGTLKDTQGQTLALNEVAREGYWKQQAQEMPAVEASEKSADIADKRQQEAEPQQPQRPRTYAEFEINKETHEVIVRIIDANNGKLVRVIPPDQLAKEIVRGNLLWGRRRRAVQA
ncbi:MAG: flagellar protein FlaG [Anaerolineae bacterium]